MVPGVLMGTPKKTVGGAAAALALAVGLIAPWEGKENDPYRDIVGVWTVCYGETRVPMRKYSDAECKVMLDKAAGGFQKKVLKVNPQLINYPYQLAAATSLAYNIGAAAYKGSTAARKFNQGDYIGACNAFKSWNKVRKNGVLVVSNGLVNRRNAEVRLCYQGF